MYKFVDSGEIISVGILDDDQIVIDFDVEEILITPKEAKELRKMLKKVLKEIKNLEKSKDLLGPEETVSEISDKDKVHDFAHDQADRFLAAYQLGSSLEVRWETGLVYARDYLITQNKRDFLLGKFTQDGWDVKLDPDKPIYVWN